MLHFAKGLLGWKGLMSGMVFSESLRDKGTRV